MIYHDKHSFFLNNCVGKDNRAFVIAYLICTSILLTCIVLSALFHYTKVIGYEDSSLMKHVTYFKILIGITGSMSLIILLPSVYWL